MNRKHDDIKNLKSLDEIFESVKSFEQLKGMVLLFNKDSEYYKFSGFVTAALLDFYGPEETILAINGNEGWITHRGNREYFKKMLSRCDAFVGEDAEHSFLLKVPIVCKDNIHCGEDCPYLITPSSDISISLEARCSLLGRNLMYHDFWIAECEESVE